MIRSLLFAAALCVSALRADTVLALPFYNQSESANLDWIGESISENVRVSLMRLFLHDTDPSAGDVVRVLSFLSEKHGDRTISEVLAEMTPKPEPEE